MNLHIFGFICFREFQECDEESGGETNDKNNIKVGKASRPQSASSNNGEVETLVSLLSPEGSDSEKEEKEVKETSTTNNKNESIVVQKQRPPLLKKVGKSGNRLCHLS